MFRQYRQKSSYRTSLVLIKRKKNTPKTHDLFLVDVSWTVGGGEGGGAGLAVPGNVAVLGGAADGQGVNAVGVAITVTAVLLPAAVSRGPHEDWPQTATTLREEKKNVVIVMMWITGHQSSFYWTTMLYQRVTHWASGQLIKKHKHDSNSMSWIPPSSRGLSSVIIYIKTRFVVLSGSVSSCIDQSTTHSSI